VWVRVKECCYATVVPTRDGTGTDRQKSRLVPSLVPTFIIQCRVLEPGRVPGSEPDRAWVSGKKKNTSVGEGYDLKLGPEPAINDN